ncbi:glucosyl-3-phosphoglycerate synthase [Tsukamurella tyrosinosolvens]|uniref:glucosyl-3-phosphoglycerate synthase n=1 Tax=Tsukamurella tyrosinosolvens TaxID=57704 RepID=UPI000DF70A1D|nr:glucosyl-3-phosphoglycerate synthase [Tsukamurella tyrosinosolvens]RDB47644.1 glucosyl-3-phosphoglycerate synthase [Tsukamurella tyrosinosolvens]
MSTAHRFFEEPRWSIDELVAAKAGRTVSVVLPALNEEATVGAVVETIAPVVGTLVDELIVLDSGSTDATAERARAAGATVISREEAIPGLPPVPGKGEALWRGVAASSGDLIAFVDSDLIDPDPRYVPRLLGPMLFHPEVHLVKAYYRRPLRVFKQGEDPTGGGRVTELVARPILAALRPSLRAILQPLGGEYAGTREFLAAVPFAAGYGVEIGLLLDAESRYGLAGIAQVNLSVRKHRNRDLRDLGVMSRQILGTALRRCGIEDSGAGITQYLVEPGPEDRFTEVTTEVSLQDRPPVTSLV